VAVGLLTVLLVPVPTAAVALFTPGSATAALPMSVQEVQWLRSRVDGRALPDPRTVSPAGMARFFRSLPPGAGAKLADRYPEVVGNLDGAPVTLRYAANARSMRDDGGTYAGWARSGRQVLSFDRRQGGRVAEVFGDLTRADRVAVLVPGVGNGLDDFDRVTRQHPYRSPRAQAQALYREERSLAPGGRVAVIAWLGYRPPPDLGRSAAREELAQAGANALDRFVSGLVTVRPSARIGVVGHSYGSVVAGLAAHRMPPQVSDIVAVGSPGMGVDRAADLHTRARIWAGCAPDDWIRDVPDVQVLGVGHGTAPVDPGFGARVFSVAGVRTHDEYLKPGTGSVRNIAEIALGRYGSVH
jgi:pimeloyl-ACP methyl ester carboxylesterase